LCYKIKIMNKQKHDLTLTLIEQWFTSLQANVAGMLIESPINDQDATHIIIHPVRNKSAAEIRIRIDKTSGFINLGAGRCFSVDETYWPNLPLIDICQAVVLGALTEELRFWKQRLTGCRWILQLYGEEKVVNNFDLWYDFWRVTLGRILGDTTTLTIHYPSYYEAEIEHT
jgi:hypothetical protein